MRNHILAAALAACLPAAAFAQRTRGGASSDPSPTPSASASLPSASAKTPTSHDLADLNPATLLISKRKKASLADSTVAQLKDVEKKISARNAPLFSAYDSVRKWTISISGDNSKAQGIGLSGGVGDSKIAAAGPSAAEQAKMQSSMRDLRALMADLRQRRQADDGDAMSVIPEPQKKAALDLLAQQDAELEKMTGGRP